MARIRWRVQWRWRNRTHRLNRRVAGVGSPEAEESSAMDDWVSHGYAGSIIQGGNGKIDSGGRGCAKVISDGDPE